jgi:putative thioredoxin
MAVDVSEADFQTAVVEASREAPVVVDFWAAWCGPCRSLGPLLERVADETGIRLAKVDVDANQNLAASFGVQSIPMVLAFKDGRVVDYFVGALPEKPVRDFFAGLAPGEADRLADDAGRASDPTERERLYREALAADRGHPKAVVGLAALLADRGDAEEGLELLERIPPSPEVDRLRARLELGSAPAADLDALRRRVEADSSDSEALLALGRAEAAAGRYGDALEHLLVAAGSSDDARKAMVDVFHLLGEEHPLTIAYRPKLASVLF